jgi:chromosome segregation ATPase
MEKEQLEKKVEWLDEERRKAQTTLSELEKRLGGLERLLSSGQAASKTLTSQGTKIDAATKEVAEVTKDVKTLRAEIKKQTQDFEKAQKQQEKLIQQETKGMAKVLEDFRKDASQIQVLQTDLNNKDEELSGLRSAVERLEESIATVVKGEEHRAQLARKLQDSSKEDAERLTTMHAEVAGLLTRLETAAKQTEHVLDSQRKVEKKMAEVAEADAGRRVEQKKFLETAALDQSERETFQADAQKRWASFTLSHEEQQREGVRQREKLVNQLTQIEDNLREVQDGIQHFSEQSERNLQALLELARDSLAENERFVSNQG